MRVIQNTFLFSELEIILIWPDDRCDFYRVVSTAWLSGVSPLPSVSALYCLHYFVQISNWIRNHNSAFQFKQEGSNSSKKILPLLLSSLPWFVRIEANELVILMITESFLFGAQGLSQRGATPPPVILGGLFKLQVMEREKLAGKLQGYYKNYIIILL